MLLVSCSELKKHSFLEFYDHYTSTAQKLSAKLEGQQMIVSSGWREGGRGGGSVDLLANEDIALNSLLTVLSITSDIMVGGACDTTLIYYCLPAYLFDWLID